MLLWLCVLAFLIGCMAGFVWTYGEATWALVKAYG